MNVSCVAKIKIDIDQFLHSPEIIAYFAGIQGGFQFGVCQFCTNLVSDANL